MRSLRQQPDTDAKIAILEQENMELKKQMLEKEKSFKT
jgi:hypothetical protein